MAASQVRRGVRLGGWSDGQGAWKMEQQLLKRLSDKRHHSNQEVVTDLTRDQMRQAISATLADIFEDSPADGRRQ
jgi:hypothetical protein